MNRNRTLGIGLVIFADDEDDVVRVAESIIRSVFTYLDLRHIKLFIKWNCRKTFVLSESLLKYSEKIEIFCHESEANIGSSAAHNILMDKCFSEERDFYLRLDPAGFLHPDALENLVTFAEAREKIGLVEAIQFPREHPKPFDPFTGKTPWCSGACLLIPRTTFDLTRGFDENIFTCFEDVDLSWSVRSNGLECFTCNAALFFHEFDEDKPAQMRRLMYESARYLAYKWSEPQFQDKIERLLLLEGHYVHINDFPDIKHVTQKSNNQSIQEWRYMLNFSMLRWE